MPDGMGSYERKRASVEFVLQKHEEIKRDAQRAGLQFKSPSKLAFQREADVGKTYIDRLRKDDPLYLRFEALREQPEERAIRRDVAQDRLNEIRQLKARLELTKAEKTKLLSDNCDLRLELKRALAHLEKYESAWHAKGQTPPQFTVIEGDLDNVEELSDGD